MRGQRRGPTAGEIISSRTKPRFHSAFCPVPVVFLRRADHRDVENYLDLSVVPTASGTFGFACRRVPTTRKRALEAGAPAVRLVLPRTGAAADGTYLNPPVEPRLEADAPAAGC